MSVSTEVQRTLVKSPPELWAELSSADGLTRHLGEVGEIRVTEVEPETRVEWEADQVSGVVDLKQSGWGTKVTLSITRELPMGNEPPADTDAPIDPQPASEPSPQPDQQRFRIVLVRPEPLLHPELQPDPGPEAIAPIHPQTEQVEAPAQRPRLFARLFRRRKPKPAAAAPTPPEQPVSAPEPAAPAEPLGTATAPAEPSPEVVALAAPDPTYPQRPEDESSADLKGELAELEAQMNQQAAELLTAVLDRLGAAHHRPFSRA